VTWQLLAVAEEDGWWRWISLSLSAYLFNGRFLLAYFLCLWGYVQKILKPSKARESLLVTNQPMTNQPLTDKLKYSRVGHGGVNAGLIICGKCGKTQPSLAADQSTVLLRRC
jgi:hypothetical protein